MTLLAPLIPVGIAIAYAIFCVATGLAVLNLLFASRLQRSSTGGNVGFVGVSFAMGAALHSWALTMFALAGAFSTQVLLSYLGVIAAAIAPVLWRADLSWLRQLRLIREHKAFQVALLTLIGLLLLRSFGPFFQGDAVAYYSMVAKEVAIKGTLGISWLAYAPYLSFGAEAHFALLYLLGGESAITFFDGLLAVGVLLTTVGLAGVFELDTRGKLIAVLIVLSTAAFPNTWGGGKVDVAATFYGLASILAVCGSLLRAHSMRLIAVAGILAAASITAKVSNALIVVPLSVALVWFFIAQPPLRSWLIKASTVFAVAAALFMGFHATKSALLLGEPLAPFYSFTRSNDVQPFWTGKNADATSAVRDQHTLSNLDVALYPLTWTFVNRKWMDGNISPLYLGLLPLSFFVPSPRRLRLAGLMGLSAISVWIAVTPFALQTRYHFIGLTLLALPTAYIGSKLWQRQGWRQVISIAVMLTLVLTLVETRRAKHAVAMTMGVLPKATYYQQYSWQKDFFLLGEYVSRIRQPAERVYLTRTAWYYPFFMEDEVIRTSQSPEEAMTTWKLDWSEEAWRYVFDRGFRVVMVGKRDLERGEADPAALQSLPPELQADPIYEDKHTTVVRLKKTP